MKRGLVPILLVAGITALSGCANNADISRNNIRATDVRDHQVRNNVDLRNHNRLTVSQRAARNVESLPEVDRAHVIMSGNDAYVAVRLSDHAGRAGTLGTGMNSTKGTTGSNRGSIGNAGNAGTTNSTGIGGTSGVEGSTTGQTGTGGTIAGSGAGGNTGTNGGTGTGNRGNTGNAGITGTGAGGNTGTLGITGTGTGGNSGTGTAAPNGTPGMTGNNNDAYSRVDTVFEKRVADQVRKANRNVHKVYVSTDPNFFNQTTSYSNAISNGRNTNNLFGNFSKTINDFFHTR